jgi:uncharacterized membrane protein
LTIVTDLRNIMATNDSNHGSWTMLEERSYEQHNSRTIVYLLYITIVITMAVLVIVTITAFVLTEYHMVCQAYKNESQ